MTLPKAFPSSSPFKNIKRFQASPILYMKEVAQQWGSPVDLNLPIGQFVLVSDPEQAQHVLATNHENYVKSKGYKEVARVLGNGLLTSEGEFWKKQRKLLQPSFHKPELKKLLPAVWQTGQQYWSGLADQETLALDEEMSGLTLTILLNSLIHYQDEELQEKMPANIIFGQEFITNRIRSLIKWPLWIPTQTHQRYHQMMAESHQIIRKCVDARVTIGEQQVNDILSVLLQFHDPYKGFEQIKSELITFLVAGHETSALGMAWTLHLLAHHPDIQDKLYDEVRNLAVLDDLDLMNFSNLKYVQNVIKESMRLYPPVWNIVRRALAPDQVGGYEIPKGKQIMNSIMELHHNPKYWNGPEAFDPDRFDRGEVQHKFQYIPFGAGPRFCIGNNFAMFELTILLVQAVRQFKFVPQSEREIDFNPLLTLRPRTPIQVQTIKR